MWHEKLKIIKLDFWGRFVSFLQLLIWNFFHNASKIYPNPYEVDCYYLKIKTKHTEDTQHNWPQRNRFSSTFLIYIEELSGAVRKLRNWKAKICEQKIAYFHATPKPIWNIFREMVRTQFNLPLKWFSTS